MSLPVCFILSVASVSSAVDRGCQDLHEFKLLEPGCYASFGDLDYAVLRVLASV